MVCIVPWYLLIHSSVICPPTHPSTNYYSINPLHVGRFGVKSTFECQPWFPRVQANLLASVHRSPFTSKPTGSRKEHRQSSTYNGPTYDFSTLQWCKSDTSVENAFQYFTFSWAYNAWQQQYSTVFRQPATKRINNW